MTNEERINIAVFLQKQCQSCMVASSNVA